MKKISSILSCISGEYFVAAELSRRGYIALLTLKNTKGIDLLVSNEDGSKTVSIQVKTTQGSKKVWWLNKKCEDFTSETLFYIFVNLNSSEKPSFHIVKSEIVADFTRKKHKKWLEAPNKNGKQHNDNPMREFHDSENKYLDKWEVLDLD